ncbi:hypothetical protein DW833_15130 [Anaerobutyricum hallii]|jgi:peptidoglycan glycosyltransferase|uniref:Uncharacterized protein n=2 Tax=Anaerobutyricum hallii TaxID=39488 RepID=A0A415U380_9FIRM|nr:hypothetical protein DW833_15130 [Anaerobutyricum hallii]RHN12534.1 hypothetical protein DWZ29_09675 [Anaerobutyricum hallii]
MKKNRINFLRRTQLLQSATLICVILMIISLVRVSALLPGVSKEADKKKSQAKAKIYEKEYVRGSILDRNGNTIAFSQKPGGARTYSHPYAFSNLVGYWSKIYGTYGVEKTMNEELVHSNCGANPKQKKGADVSLTIDAALQERAYKDIEKYKGSVAVLDAKTGEILALASSPSFNVSEIEDKWKKINEKEGVFLSNAYQNPVAPGSVFKLITSKEIVEAGIEREEVEDTGSITVNGQTIRNYGGKAYGSISFREGFVKSSNVYFMNRALKLGGLRLYKTGKSFLLGEDISLDFATIHSNFDLKGYEDNVVATTAFGQGETLVTPLQMAMVTQSIANDGVMLKPYLFKSVVNGKGQTTAEGKSEKLVETMDTDTAQEIKEAMKAAAQSYGMSTVGEKEYSIAAKTGTAERGDGTNNAWLVTFAPADNPQYVIVANRLKTTEIGKTLAPVVEDLYNTLFDAN